LLPIVEVIPLQLFAYYVATKKGYNVDHPRNLVKAVVTE
jgi:glucosamine--fructose-6-phosphate aminotransferase (isomerizing)